MAGIRVGQPDVRLDASAHTKGVEQGNRRRRQRGLSGDGRANARRSTGIRWREREPILAIMPNLPPG
jgi:hypothetical protein